MQVVTRDEMYAVDRYAGEEIGLTGLLLMENAGQAAAKKIMERLTGSEQLAVLIGTGNNGGDGFVLARVLKSMGYGVDVWLIPEKNKIKEDAKKAMIIYERSGFSYRSYHQEGHECFLSSLANTEVIVDALLGIGLKESVRSPYANIIDAVNSQSAFILSIDLPSGVPADGGPVSLAIQADETITLQCPKVGAYTFPSADYYGKLTVVDIGIPPKAFQQLPVRKVWQVMDVKTALPVRKPSSHKGTYGKGLVVGGSLSMPGAPIMTAKAALRSGSGLLTVAVPEEIHSIAASHISEAMFTPFSNQTSLFQKPDEQIPYDTIAIGPGLGRDSYAEGRVREALTLSVPLVIDADGLFHLKTMLPLLKKRQAPTILTPHSGEMARLLEWSVEEVEHNRIQLSKQFAKEYGLYLVLKGPYTIVTTPTGSQFINTTGNAALAKGGSGDVLTGMILAFLMQHKVIQEALSNAVYLHGAAADYLVKTSHSKLDVLASDLIEVLPILLKKYTR
ncbi:NAD(P)H-hydrate dehydratase [Bacillus taeanensis]|uniref:Bifunctional NAD(P)H-hydrate repair enzyme n=1 Tax=Bacillus taeanensis TaxID=273032 RepID=A0A366XUM5_9BACI|nr:bifunctional ADP-dependent NAD(P)H-hydrate dehydratase/NAD(P)H-hydrate epimerase [Bacillus taeanensis]